MGANQLFGNEQFCDRVSARDHHRNVRAELLIYGEKRRFVMDSGNPGQKCRFAAARPPAAIARFPAPR
jgi:hypothetical protein